MGKHGKILLVLGVLGSLALIGAAVQGYGVHGAATDRGPLQTHLIYSLGATLAVFFSHTWVIVYLLSLRRELRKWHRLRPDRQEPEEATTGSEPMGESSGAGEGAGEDVPVSPSIGWAAAASVLVLASFLLGPATLLLVVPPWVHGGTFYLALTVQIGALVVELRALGRGDRALAACRRQEATPAPA